MLLWIEEDHIISVQQTRVAFDEHREIALIAEAEPRAAIRQRVSTNGRGGVERRAHAPSDISVPRASAGLGRIDLGCPPNAVFESVGAALVTTRDEWRAGLSDSCEGRDRIALA